MNQCVIGIDIGGTNIKFGLFDQHHSLVRTDEIKTPKHVVVERIIEQLSSMIQGMELKGIGISSAGIIDFENKRIKSSSNIPSLVNIPIGEKLEEEFNTPVFIENDANCAALAESEAGVSKSVSHSIFVTLGTGIGGGMIYQNKIIHGRNGYAGEIGHMTIHPHGHICGCGRKGCWETYASGSALQRMIQEEPSLAQSTYTPESLFATIDTDPLAKKVVDKYIEYLAIGLINLQYINDPDMIVLGGGVIHSSAYWWDLLLDKVQKMTKLPLNLQQATLKNNAGMIGASYLVKTSLKEKTI